MKSAIDLDALPEFKARSKYAAVLDTFRSEYSVDPTNATSAGLLARIYCRYAEFEVASKLLDFAVDVFPSDHKVLKMRADLQSRCPDKSYRNGSAAVRDATLALDLARDDGWFDARSYEECTYLETLAAGYAVVGDKGSATAALTYSIEIAKTNTLRKRLKNSLTQIEAGQILVEQTWNLSWSRRQSSNGS